MIKKYKKLPVEIEAVLFTLYDPHYSSIDVANWCGGRFDFSGYDDTPRIYITTLEGVMCASEGDYIIKGVDGEFYPCKPDIFKKTYEVV